jgi:hypothetical protein
MKRKVNPRRPDGSPSCTFTDRFGQELPDLMDALNCDSVSAPAEALETLELVLPMWDAARAAGEPLDENGEDEDGWSEEAIHELIEETFAKAHEV